MKGKSKSENLKFRQISGFYEILRFFQTREHSNSVVTHPKQLKLYEKVKKCLRNTLLKFEGHTFNGFRVIDVTKWVQTSPLAPEGG